MSIEGKKKALLNNALNVANTTLKLEAEAIKHQNYGYNFVAVMMREAAKATAITIANKIKSTPHQYFNADGKIDKRKKRRHDRKVGVKAHAARIIKVKTGKPTESILIGIDPASGYDKSVHANVTIKNGLATNIAILDEFGANGGDE